MEAPRSARPSDPPPRPDRSDEVTRLLLLADTHLRDGQSDRLLARIDGLLDDIDVIVHAGDIVDASILDALASRTPQARILAARGNNDGALTSPERVEAEVAGCLIGVVHDSGPKAGRCARLRRWFPACDLVVFGHSHLPWHEVDVSPDGHHQHQVNPGSAILRRRAPTCTVAQVILSHGEVTDVGFLPVG